ncbi:metallopeptidase TldD-related protein [Clostridium frigidicarnis]|uniref:PmbA protein n=1 Tax=Clostridium frigidicarnis TaxID=84698 RepID=A0A1I0ZYM8_9CLOT|nr:metallopeptidase TldD-related protein [Clostridium frigidicarnis]SFB30741.1 PmbA protein [Clostridium frigidicarnis]
MLKEKYIENIKETSISIANSNIDAVRLKNDTKTSLRVYKDGIIGVAGAIGKYNEDELEKQAIEGLEQNIPYPYQLSGYRKENVDKRLEIIKEEELVSEVDKFLCELKNNHPEFSFSNKINLKETSTRILNDNVLDLQYADRGITIQLLFKHKNSSSLFDGFIGAEERKYDRNLLLQESEIILNTFNNKVNLPKNKKYPVVFAHYIPVNKLINDLSGKAFGTGSSLFSNKIDEKIFSENFTFHQSLNPQDVINMPFFDAEGVVNNDYRCTLIENGVLKALYTDKKTSTKFNLPLTGSSTSFYDGVPVVSPLNYKIKESNNTLKELIGGDMAIISMMADGGEFTPKGDFATPVQLAFLFDGEKILGRLPEIQFTSNIYDMFGNGFRGVSKDNLLPFSTSKFVVMDLDVSTI